jgi:hypothetical protein
MGARRTRLDQRQADQRTSRKVNGLRKMKERARRRLRMVELLRKGNLPYVPGIMSWLSQQLGKPSRRIVQADVDQILQGS